MHNCAVSIQTHHDWIFFLMSLMQTRNNAGPRTEHWRTDDVTLPQFECDPLTEEVLTLLHIKLSNHFRGDPIMS